MYRVKPNASHLFGRRGTVVIVIVMAIFAATGAWAQMEDDDADWPDSPFGWLAGEPTPGHEPVGDPAALDGAAAERIYRSILPRMQAGYARSGDPLAWAYVRWLRLNAVPYRSHRHGNVFVNNYVGPLAADSVLRGVSGALPPGSLPPGSLPPGSLPPGSLIVKDSFIVTEAGEIRANGDWRYLVIEPDGALIGVSEDTRADPRTQPCAACHNAAPAGQDRLYLVPEQFRR